MISRAAIKKNKGKSLNVDLERCHDYIDQQIELIPSERSSTKDVIYRNIRVIRNGTAKTFEVPISYSESSENSVKHTDKTEIDLQGNINAKGNLGGGKSEKKKSKKKKEKEDESAAAAGAGASAGADAGASAEWKKTDSHETFDKNHQELHVGETKIIGRQD